MRLKNDSKYIKKLNGMNQELKSVCK